MTFLTSILLGLCMGSGALFSVCWGQRDLARLRRQTHAAFVLIAVCTVVLNAAAFLLLDAMKNAPVRPGGGLAPDAVVSVRHFLRHRRDVSL